MLSPASRFCRAAASGCSGKISLGRLLETFQLTGQAAQITASCRSSTSADRYNSARAQDEAMATALAAQLAQIAAKSSNPLDLKAQKKAHSQSLLFDQHVAASQDYDTIYQVCFEGYLELCDLDRRFGGFARSIFSEQSKRQERSQMTSAENKELDEVLESFLGLVGARLLLKPALKAVEWLVRRFRSVIRWSDSTSPVNYSCTAAKAISL